MGASRARDARGHLDVRPGRVRGIALVCRAVSTRPACRAWTSTTALESVIGDLASFGRLLRSSEGATTNRCASVDADVVGRIVAAFAARGSELGPGDGEYFAELPWSGGRGSVLLGMYAMFPDDPLACPGDVGT